MIVQHVKEKRIVLGNERSECTDKIIFCSKVFIYLNSLPHDLSWSLLQLDSCLESLPTWLSHKLMSEIVKDIKNDKPYYSSIIRTSNIAYCKHQQSNSTFTNVVTLNIMTIEKAKLIAEFIVSNNKKTQSESAWSWDFNSPLWDICFWMPMIPLVSLHCIKLHSLDQWRIWALWT